MKTISTLFASLIFTTSIFASDFRSASLTVKSETKGSIVVVVDDKRFDVASASIMIGDLDACEHDVTVYQSKYNSSTGCFEKTGDVLFDSRVSLKPATNLKISIDECGAVTMSESKSRKRRLADTWNGENYNDNDPANSGSHSPAISSYDFSRVMWAIGKEVSEANRLKSAEQIIHANYLTVDQVKQLAELFCSEGSKLEIAKLAYDKTVDQSDYYAINDIFKSNDSRNELARCITR